MSKKIPKYAKEFKNYEVMLFKNNSVTIHPVYNVNGGCIETDIDILPEEEGIKIYNETLGGFTYLFNIDMPAKVESENLKTLRRNVAIKNLMSYDKEKGIDLKIVMAYLVAISAIIFS